MMHDRTMRPMGLARNARPRTLDHVLAVTIAIATVLCALVWVAVGYVGAWVLS